MAGGGRALRRREPRRDACDAFKCSPYARAHYPSYIRYVTCVTAQVKAGCPMRGRPVQAAYADVGALNVSCANCGARAVQWCIKPDGQVRRVPCIARAATGIDTGDGKPYAVHDFSDPRHEREPGDG